MVVRIKTAEGIHVGLSLTLAHSVDLHIGGGKLLLADSIHNIERHAQVVGGLHGRPGQSALIQDVGMEGKHKGSGV